MVVGESGDFMTAEVEPGRSGLTESNRLVALRIRPDRE
jgi:hypothetical protein